jgi:copper resistance protein B
MSGVRIAMGVLAAFAVDRAFAQESGPETHAHDSTHRDADGMSGPVSGTETSNSSAQAHVPPQPPQHVMEEMSGRAMIDAMEMDDTAPIATVRLDRLERGDGAVAWKLSASAGGDFDRLLVRSEGERENGAFERSDVEALWSHAVAPFWDAQMGVRHDFGGGRRIGSMLARRRMSATQGGRHSGSRSTTSCL